MHDNIISLKLAVRENETFVLVIFLIVLIQRKPRNKRRKVRTSKIMLMESLDKNVQLNEIKDMALETFFFRQGLLISLLS